MNRGKLEVVADNGKTMLATLVAGCYFGEISILNMGQAGDRTINNVISSLSTKHNIILKMLKHSLFVW